MSATSSNKIIVTREQGLKEREEKVFHTIQLLT